MAQTEETEKEKRKENRAPQASVLIHSRLRAQVYDRNEIGIKGFLVFV